MTKQPNYENCNHSLKTKKAAKTAEEILAVYGNAPFDWRSENYSQAVVGHLLEQRYLKHGADGFVYHTGKLVIGAIPKKRKAA